MRPVPRSVPAAAAQPLASFCSHCGFPPGASGVSPTRVCAECGLGLLLQAEHEMAPAADAAFLVVDDSLAVCGLSHAAEELFGVEETLAVNRHLTDFLMPADAEARGGNLLALVVAAASDGGPPRSAVVRPAGEFGVRFRVRIGRCGPAPAALLVFA